MYDTPDWRQKYRALLLFYNIIIYKSLKYVRIINITFDNNYLMHLFFCHKIDVIFTLLSFLYCFFFFCHPQFISWFRIHVFIPVS